MVSFNMADHSSYSPDDFSLLGAESNTEDDLDSAHTLGNIDSRPNEFDWSTVISDPELFDEVSSCFLPNEITRSDVLIS